MPLIEVYSRRGCHLCELLVEELLDLSRGRAEVLVHDIDTRPDWQARYGSAVPVVESGGKRICRHRLDRDAVLALLAVGA